MGVRPLASAPPLSMIPRLFMDTLALRTAYGNVEIHGNVENTLIHTGNNTLQMDRDRGFFYIL